MEFYNNMKIRLNRTLETVNAFYIFRICVFLFEKNLETVSILSFCKIVGFSELDILVCSAVENKGLRA